MSTIALQVHTKFKVFSGLLGPDHSLGPLAGEVAAWVARSRIAPKSIGVEYVESAGRVILTVGYRDDEEPYHVALHSVPVGKLAKLDEADMASLERSMTAASARLDNIICHELYVTAERDFVMVFMTYVPA